MYHFTHFINFITIYKLLRIILIRTAKVRKSTIKVDHLNYLLTLFRISLYSQRHLWINVNIHRYEQALSPKTGQNCTISNESKIIIGIIIYNENISLKTNGCPWADIFSPVGLILWQIQSTPYLFSLYFGFLFLGGWVFGLIIETLKRISKLTGWSTINTKHKLVVSDDLQMIQIMTKRK